MKLIEPTVCSSTYQQLLVRGSGKSEVCNHSFAYTNILPQHTFPYTYMYIKLTNSYEDGGAMQRNKKHCWDCGKKQHFKSQHGRPTNPRSPTEHPEIHTRDRKVSATHAEGVHNPHRVRAHEKIPSPGYLRGSPSALCRHRGGALGLRG